MPTSNSSTFDATQFRKDCQESFDVDSHEVSSEGAKLELLTSIESFGLAHIKAAARKTLSATEADDVQQDLNLLWHMFIKTATVIGHDSASQDKLVSLLLWTKEFDTLHKALHPETTNTKEWDTYKFFESLQFSWQELFATGSLAEKCNLAAFAAKAMAIGISQDHLSQISLWFLREALETDDAARTISVLPATAAFIENCHYHLLTFSGLEKLSTFKEYDYLNSLGVPGPLAEKKAGVMKVGYSMKRWLFWRQRLQELAHHEDKIVAKMAEKAFMCMVVTGRELDYEVPGENNFRMKLEKTMYEALSKSGKSSIGVEEIEVDVDWVD